jgi:hypothetical protein
MNEFNIPLKTQTEKNGFCWKCERKKNGGKTKAGEMCCESCHKERKRVKYKQK